MGKVGASILGGAVGFFTGGVGGLIAGAAQPWATPPPPAQTRTGATSGGPAAPGLGIAGAGLPEMRGSGLGSLTPSSLPGAPAAQFFGAPPRQPTFTPRPSFAQAPGGMPPTAGGGFAARLRAMRTGAAPAGRGVPRPGSFAARLAARRAGAAPTFPTFPTFPAAPPPSPFLAPLMGLAGLLARPRAPAPPRIESIFGQPAFGAVSPSGVVSIF